MKKVLYYTATTLVAVFLLIYCSEGISESVVLAKPVLVQEGNRGFNITQYGDAFYEVDQKERPMDAQNLGANSRHKWFSGGSSELAKTGIYNYSDSLPKLSSLSKTKNIFREFFL